MPGYVHPGRSSLLADPEMARNLHGWGRVAQGVGGGVHTGDVLVVLAPEPSSYTCTRAAVLGNPTGKRAEFLRRHVLGMLRLAEFVIDGAKIS